MLNYRSIESSIKNLEIQMGQLAKQITERPTNSFGANTEKNPKEECKVFFTRRESTKKKMMIGRMCLCIFVSFELKNDDRGNVLVHIMEF